MTGYVTTKEAATILGYKNESRIRQLILAGELPAQKVGGVVLLIARPDISKLKKKRIRKTRKAKD